MQPRLDGLGRGAPASGPLTSFSLRPIRKQTVQWEVSGGRRSKAASVLQLLLIADITPELRLLSDQRGPKHRETNPLPRSVETLSPMKLVTDATA